MPAKRVALIYALFGAGWILVSDAIAGWLFPTVSALAFGQTLKGVLFVTVTAALVYGLVARAERDNARTRSVFTDVVERAPIGIFIQAEGRFAYVNPVACLAFGASSAADLIGTPVLDRFHPDHREAVRARIEQLNTGRRAVPRVEEVYLRLDGTPVDAEVSAVPYLHEGSHGALVFFQDITERKQAERDRQRLEDQLRQAQKMEAVGRLAGGVAHDFNNMLQAIIGGAEIIGDLARSDPRFQEPLEEIRGAALRSADLTRQLLAFARRQPIAPKTIDLNDTIAGMLKMLRRLIGENINLRWQPGANLGTLRLDPTQIDQVLANLVVNARDAIKGVGVLTIETKAAEFDEAACAQAPGSAPGKYVMLAVSDNGCGMDKVTMASIFEPFFTTKALGHGTGLGLPTVYGIVKQNGGFINVYSEPGRGTTFRIYLPRQEAAGDLGESAPAAAPTPTGSETILLVEDEPSLLRLGRLALEKLGYTVLSAGTPQGALRLAREWNGPLQLLVTDVVLPEMSGRDLWEKLAGERPAIKCLFMSGYTADAISNQGVLAEGVNFIPKPFSTDALGRKVREALAG